MCEEGIAAQVAVQSFFWSEIMFKRNMFNFRILMIIVINLFTVMTVSAFGKEASLTQPYVDPVYIYPSTDSPQTAGDEFWVDIWVGEVYNQVRHLYGVAFVVLFDATWISPVLPLDVDVSVVPEDFLGFRNELKILPPIVASDSIATAVTRTDTNRAANGYGKIMKIRFKSRSETPNNTDVCFYITEVAAVDSAWNEIILTPKELCLTIVQPPGIRPNPFTPNNDGYNDHVEFNLEELKNEGGVITIFNLWGKMVRQIERGIIWDGKDDVGNLLEPGSYLYVVKSRGKVIAKGVIGLAR